MLPSLTDRTRIDRWTVVFYFIPVLTGLLMLWAVGRPPEGYENGLLGLLAAPVGKQFVWLVISLGAWFVVNLLIDRDLWTIGAYPIYGVTVVLLVLVLLVGKEINNARSWFSLAGLTFQPSEIAKFGTCLAMAAYLSQYAEKLDRPGTVGPALGLWLLPAALIVLQPDPGSALVFASFFLVMYREGFPGGLIVFGFFSAAMFLLGILFSPFVLLGALLCFLLIVLTYTVPRRKLFWRSMSWALSAGAMVAYLAGHGGWALPVLLVAFCGLCAYLALRRLTRQAGAGVLTLVWGTALAFLANLFFNNFLMPHQQDRINAWLRPEGMDERGALYNIIQSKLAIAGGGLNGRGLVNNTMTKYDYVPEQETDFIFSAVGETQGFVGSIIVIGGFLLLLWRLSVLAERQKRTFARAYAYGVIGIILIHVLVNIGMTVGLMPVIGIPLPFVSKGGSSLLAFTLMIAVLLKLDRHREEV